MISIEKISLKESSRYLFCPFPNNDGFVKSPSAALRCFLRRCGVLVSTPHSSGFARLASGAFYIAIQILTFYESIKVDDVVKSRHSRGSGRPERI
jgi:hypothetical protein